MRTEAPFTGIGVALVTLFDHTRAVDEKATADLAARLVDDGVRAVVVAGSTGEADALDGDERRRLLDEVRARVDGVPVLAGTGGAWAGEAARRTAAARDGGADAALVLSPRLVADQRPYYAEVAAAAGDLPLLAYHYPAQSPPGIPVETLPELPVVGAKDSSDHDKVVGALLDKLDQLGIADNTIVVYSTDNGPHMNSWPDGGMTPFRSEKN